jgi:4-amino-4-deoxy-L-arabinose transferase-like glycosyltransferase
MSAAAVRAQGARERSSLAIGRLASSSLAVMTGLYALAFAVRLWVVGLVSFPVTEGSAYYLAVARNVVGGRGLVIDALWSYATPPLTLPRPAFELWQPLATFIAAVPMALTSPDLRAAQLAFAALGALLAPLTWLVARDTARRLELPDRRLWFVSAGAGLLAAVCGPLLFATAVPDSTLPFTVLAVAACVVLPAAVSGDRRALVGLGVLLGLAYLTRMEAIWLGVTFVLVLMASRADLRTVARRSLGVAAAAALVALPWWLRNVSVFGSPFPAQVTDNLFLTRNEQIFAYLDRPTLAEFLRQGAAQIVANIGQALWHQAVNVLLVPAAPIIVVAVLTLLIATWRRRRHPATLSTRSPGLMTGALAALLISGSLTYLVTALLFPVATLWGTFEHAAGPLLVGLIVTAVIGGDAFVAWLVARRHWSRENGWLAPAALIAMTLPLALLQVRGAEREASVDQSTMAAVAGALPTALTQAGVSPASPIITDKPIWLSDALNRATLALPDESAESVLALARAFGASTVAVVDVRGRYPQALLAADATCFTPLDSSSTGGAVVFVIDKECLT